MIGRLLNTLNHQGSLFKPKRYAKKLVKRCMGGVMITVTKITGKVGGETGREKRRAPAMKSS